MRILRTIFLLTGVAVLVPAPPQGAAPQADADSRGLLMAAVEAVSDFAGFCARQPSACATASYVAGKVEAKAQNGLQLAYGWVTGSAATGAAGGQSTLRADDLVPAWRSPASPKKG